MSREGLSLDLISEDPSTCAAQFNALSLNCVDSVNNNLRRSSSLRSGKTPPGTPASKKFVRFADVLGLDLADVRTYLDEIPSVPQSAYEDLVCPQDEDEDEETYQQGQFCVLPSSVSTNSKLNITLLALFNQPGYEPNFFQLLNTNKVCLEKVIITQYYDGHPIVSGTVRVRNEHFNKAVYVRYTTDQWRSYQEVLAKYIENSCDGYSDKFSFVLYTQGWGLAPLKTVAMCFRYVTGGQEYWDSNGGRNYTFQCHMVSS
ncbi:hypothetical protein M8J76_012647 [Diaphorina citri]|nr:hypothetical protein M8J76_012647 [Diaphorina citri]